MRWVDELMIRDHGLGGGRPRGDGPFSRSDSLTGRADRAENVVLLKIVK